MNRLRGALCMMLLLAVSAVAAPVDSSRALTVARHFYQSTLARDAFMVQAVPLVPTSLPDPIMGRGRGDPTLYLFNVAEGGGGFVLVAGDDCVTPILAYSTSPMVTDRGFPPAFVKWIENYADQIREARAHGLQADMAVRQEWEVLQDAQSAREWKSTAVVAPLLKTQWDQPHPYNLFCPYDARYGARAVTGCVATAMAQIMKYHNYPAKGAGSHCYQENDYGNLCANFGATTYNWSSMPNKCTSINEAVARLMSDCGISVDMNYGVDASGSHSERVPGALVNYFRYKSTASLLNRDMTNEAQWIQRIKQDLDASLPVYYSGMQARGGGHAFVADGYDSRDYFHFNWGWSGSHDGYFNVRSLTPGSWNFSRDQKIVVGIIPDVPQTQKIELYAPITVTPNPVEFRESFEIHCDVTNMGSTSFTGDFLAVIFTEEGGLVDTLGLKQGYTLPPNHHYTNGLTFSCAGLESLVPGDYLAAILFKPQGKDWQIVDDGNYQKAVSFSVEAAGSQMKLYSPIVFSTQNIESGTSLSVTVEAANYGTTEFRGTITIDVHDAQGTYLDELVRKENVQIQGGYYRTLVFDIPVLEVPPGGYLLAVWYQPSGGEWDLLSDEKHPNPVPLIVRERTVTPDPYENNDNEDNPSILAANFSGEIATIRTTGANLHSTDDQDHYRLTLPPGYSYTIQARIHDSYDSGIPETFTVDAQFEYDDGLGWSNSYDDVMGRDSIKLANGGSVLFWIASYFEGDVGTYAFDLYITRTRTSLPPPPPVLLSPVNGATAIGTDPTLAWQLVDGATSYNVQIAANASFSPITRQWTSVTGSNVSVTGLSQASTYYWRVAATNATGTGNWSAPFSFTTRGAQLPDAPSLVYPADRAGSVTVPLTFQWTPLAGVLSYDLQASTSAGFSTLVVDQSGLTSAAHYTEALQGGISYYWRVRARNAEGSGPWSSVWSFSTAAGSLSAPVMIAPGDGEANVPTSTTFRWAEVPQATRYELQASTSSGFGSLVINQASLTSTTFGATGLQPGTKYWWRVRAANAGGTSAWYSAWSFTTASAGTAPAVPTLDTPADNATGIPVMASLRWHLADGATSYDIEVSASASMSPVLEGATQISRISYSCASLAEGRMYYWRVRARNAYGTSAWSVIRSFTTVGGSTLSAPVLLAPAHQGVVTATPTFAWNSVTGATSYTLQISEDSGFGTLELEQSCFGVNAWTVPSYRALRPGGIFWWRVRAECSSDKGAWSDARQFVVQSSTGLEDRAGVVPADVSIESIYPIPLRGTSTMRLHVHRPSAVRISLYDIHGRLLRSCCDRFFDEGVHMIALDGRALPAGICYLRLQTTHGMQVRPLLILH